MNPEIIDTAPAAGLSPETDAQPAPPDPVLAAEDPGPVRDPGPAHADEATVVPSSCGCTAPASSGGGGDNDDGGYVYVLGRVRAVFPNVSIQHEFFQVAGAGGQTDSTDADAMYRVLSAPENRYLARQMCFVLSVQGVDTYILEATDPTGLDELVEALRPVDDGRDLAVVVGALGPVAPPSACQGLSVPVVGVVKTWGFDRKELIGAIERPQGTSRKEFEKVVGALLDRLLQLSDNAGTDPVGRVLNYLTVRCQEMYQKTNEKRAEGSVLTSVEAGPSRLSSRSQTVITVVFSYTNLQTNVVEKYFVRVGLAGYFPFPVTPFQEYFAR
ncbi:cyanobactin maturation protease PatG family protein [Streptomyces sp. NPDC055815]